MSSFPRLLFALILFLVLAGCATMNQSECLNADWNMIGMEDGSKGRSLSYIGNHRKACADYNVRPDMAAYEDGYAAGIREFCTEVNGYLLGKTGGSYSGVCPKDLDDTFLSGYEAGRALHTASVEASKAASAVRSGKSQLEKLKEGLKTKEAQLVSSNTSEANRIRLLEEIRADEKKVEELEGALPALEADQLEKQTTYEQLKSLDRY